MIDHSTYNEPLSDEVNLLDYWRVLVKRKKLLILFVGAAAIISIGISLTLPRIYASAASLLPPQENVAESALLSARLPGEFSGMASGLLGIKSPSDLWVGILKSQTVRDAVVAEFNLKEVYDVETNQEARKNLTEALSIKKSKEGIISITVEDQDPVRAAEMANAFVNQLDKFNKNIIMTSGGRMKAFVEKRLEEAKQALAKTEEALKTFQEEKGAVKLDTQSEAIIGAIGKVKGKLMAKEVELQTLLSFAAAENPQVKLLETEVRELKKGLRGLEEGEKGGGVSSRAGSTFIPTASFPDLGLQYTRLIREGKIQQTLYSLLTEQYEMARIQEAKDTPTLQILDTAKIPEKWIKPKKVLIVLLSTFTATFFGVFLVFFMEYIETALTEASRREITLNPPSRLSAEFGRKGVRRGGKR